MWKYFINNLIVLPLKFIGYLLFAVIGSLILCFIFYIGLPAIIILSIITFIYFCYYDAKRRYTWEREDLRLQLSRCCEGSLIDLERCLAYKKIEKVDEYKDKLIKYMEEYKKEFGEDSYYKAYCSGYHRCLKSIKELEKC